MAAMAEKDHSRNRTTAPRMPLTGRWKKEDCSGMIPSLSVMRMHRGDPGFQLPVL